MPTNNESQENKTEQDASKSSIHSSVHNPANRSLLIAIASLLALILLGGVFALGRQSARPYDRVGLFSQKPMAGMPEFGTHRVGSLLNTSNRVVGVVTKVDGANFTVASNGATQDVQTNSSTQYTGGSGVKLNDSVLVTGSTSGSTFTADRVIINL